MFRKPISISVVAGTIAAGLWALPASGGAPGPLDSHAQYQPIQSISYEFGSKFMSGYFVQVASACSVALMVIEKSDPEKTPPASPTRVRLLLNPGQTAGLDSEEGRSVNFTCGEGASTLLVDTGDRESLVALQTLALSSDITASH